MRSAGPTNASPIRARWISRRCWSLARAVPHLERSSIDRFWIARGGRIALLHCAADWESIAELAAAKCFVGLSARLGAKWVVLGLTGILFTCWWSPWRAGRLHPTM